MKLLATNLRLLTNKILKNPFFTRRFFIILFMRINGPPRILKYCSKINVDILRTFGAHVEKNVVVLSPITLHAVSKETGYKNLVLKEKCVLSGNNYLDLTSRIVLEKGVSIGPSVVIMTHNRYNHNPFLESRLPHNCGRKDVLIKEGTGIKAGALVTMGVTIGKNTVIGGGAVVNRDIPDNSFAVGVPARVIKEIK